MITNYNNISKAIQLHVTTVNTRIITSISICPLHCALNEGSGGCCNNELRVHCKNQTGRPVDSAVYE